MSLQGYVKNLFHKKNLINLRTDPSKIVRFFAFAGSYGKITL